MNIEDIMDMWTADAKIDDVDLDRESLGVPNLHAKYLKVLYQQKLKLRKLNIQKKT